MPTDLKSRLRARVQAAGADVEQHDQAADVPAELGQVAGHEDVVPAISKTAMSWLQKYRAEFEEALPKHVDPAVFFAAVRAVLPDLTRCTPASTLQALLACARAGLVPDGTLAVIKREGTTAVFVPMYQGFIDQMYRSGMVSSVCFGVIHEAEEWALTPSAPSPNDFHHRARPELSPDDRGPVILAYAFAWMRDGSRSQVIVLSRSDAEAIRDEYSEAFRRAEDEGRRDTFWHTHFIDMWIKSCVRRLVKRLPTTPEVRALSDVDDAGDEGRVQVMAVPDEEAAFLLAAANAAGVAAEASQVPAAAVPVRTRQLENARRRAGRHGAKRQRGGVKAPR